MTKKLFLKDSYTKVFNANVVESFKLKDSYAVILDQTYFYPEGGGQPCDLGYIEDSKVLEVYYYDNKIIHLVDNEISENEVKCKIDWNRRLSLMQQHLGQHILSRVLEIEYDVNTIGFHIGDDYVTIDIDKKLDENELINIENKSNEIVYKNLKVNDRYPSEKELKEIPLRKEPSVKDNIRIIEIDNFDFSPCGGTHLKTTSEVGMIKVKKIKNYKKGLRIEFICGRWALLDYQMKNNYINKISDILGIKDIEVLERVDILNNDLIETKKEINRMKEEILENEITNLSREFEMVNENKVISKVFENKSIKELRYIVNNIVSNNQNFLICLLSIEDGKVNLVIGKSKDIETNIKEKFESYISLLNGKGGGSPFLLQGSGKNVKKVDDVIISFKKI